jgi:hypothetical protein
VIRSMHPRLRTLAIGLVVVQIADALASAQMSTTRLDHVGFPHALRPLLPTIKVSTSVGLLVGLRWAPVGTVALPAATVGIASTLCFFEYLSHSSRGPRQVMALGGRELKRPGCRATNHREQ